MMIKIKIVVFILMLPMVSMADIRLNGLFADHMVVQQETEILIWGWADPNEKVSITTSWGATTEAITLADSTWRSKLMTPKAGGPFQITLEGKNKIVLDDVLSGEVWLCTGQSNMDFRMSQLIKDARESQYQPLVEHIRNEIATADDPWLRHIEVSRSTSIYNKKTNFEGEWISANPDQTSQITATGYFFAKELREKLGVPVGLVECSWGGTRIQPWVSKEVYMSNEDFKEYYETQMEWAEAVIKKVSPDDYVDSVYLEEKQAWIASGKTIAKPFPRDYPTTNKQFPATLYNGMLSAIIPFAIKGTIWYQGESNGHHLPDEYEKYFTALITSWRSEWGQGDFPFYWTQLAGYKTSDDRSDGWATVNDQLRRTMKLPNTGMAVLHDIGESKDIHPHNKMDAGKRLALWALAKDYAIDQTVYSGPLYKSAKFKKGKAIIEFDERGSGLMVGNKLLLNDAVEVNEPLKWFEIAGEDGEWKSALAKIVDKDKVQVSSSDVPSPKMVRYAWSPDPTGANLYNKEGLPAAVFTTEDKVKSVDSK